MQAVNFGRVYAAYGGVFIVFYSMGWRVDKIQPDRFDLVGGAVALIGMAIIMYAPRT